MRRATYAVTGWFFSVAAVAKACPFCDGGPSGSNEVRAVVFGEDFWTHLACTVAPFGVFLALAALIHFSPLLAALGRGRSERTLATQELGPVLPGRRNE